MKELLSELMAIGPYGPLMGLLVGWIAIWMFRRFWRQLRHKPVVRTEGKPLKLPRREGPHIRVPYDTQVPSIIEIDGELFHVTNIEHDFNPAGCQTYAQVEPVVVPPSRYELLMRDDDAT